MKKRSFLLVCFYILIPFLIFSADKRIAVLDFSVESDNPSFKYLGKGFAEFVAVELARNKELILIDREKRNSILEEQSFALSGLADDDSSIEIGNLLTANYLMSGSIFDLLGDLAVSFQVLDVETGIVIYKDQVDGKPTQYKNMISLISYKILDLLDLNGKQIIDNQTTLNDQDAEIILSKFSEAVEAYDDGDMEEAREKLLQAKVIDRKNEAVDIYLDKTSPISSKFSIISPPFYSRDNPAVLGLLEKDVMYINGGYGTLLFKDTIIQDEAHYPLSGLYGPSGDLAFAVQEGDVRLKIGYLFPLLEQWGVGFEAFFSMIEHRPRSITNTQNSIVSQQNAGGIVSLGKSFNKNFSMGASLMAGSVFYRNLQYQGQYDENAFPPVFLFGGELGFLLRNSSGSLVYSFYSGYSNFVDYEHDLINSAAVYQVKAPIYLDQSLTMGFNRMRTYFIIKNTADINIYSQLSYFQFVTPLEQWFSRSFSFRAGPVFSFTTDSNPKVGLGLSAGTTMIISNNWEIDLQGIFRRRPSKIIAEEMVPELIISFGISKHDTFRTRSGK